MRRRLMLLELMRGAAVPALTTALILCLMTGISNLERGQDDQGQARLEETIRRAAVTCYAAEGIYPPTLSYLEQHYGLQVDARRYTVYYNVAGSNLMPAITVLKSGD